MYGNDNSQKIVSKISDIDKISWLILIFQSFQNLSYILSSPFLIQFQGVSFTKNTKGGRYGFLPITSPKPCKSGCFLHLVLPFLISLNFHLFVLAFSFQVCILCSYFSSQEPDKNKRSKKIKDESICYRNSQANSFTPTSQGVNFLKTRANKKTAKVKNFKVGLGFK